MGRAVLLALLIVLALPLGVAGAPTSDQSATGHDLADVAILTLNETQRSSFTTTSVDVGTSLAVRHDAGDARIDRYALDERLRTVPGAEGRETLLLESLTAVERRITALHDEERALRAAYAARELDPATYVRRLARINAQAGELRLRLDRIRTHADLLPQSGMESRIQLAEAALFGLEGPVRQQSFEAVSGADSPTQVYVEVSESGVVLSAIGDGRFVRETYRADNLDAETAGRTSFSEAVAITERLYAPYAYNQSLTDRNELIGREGGIYLFTMGLREGLVSAYIDGSTGDAFFEVQERQLDLLPARPTATGAANGTRVEVHRTFPGGPLQVVVADNETEVPRQVPVHVAETRLETGPDGTVWTLGPGLPFQVTAEGPRGNVTVSVRPLPPTPVGAEA